MRGLRRAVDRSHDVGIGYNKGVHLGYSSIRKTESYSRVEFQVVVRPT